MGFETPLRTFVALDWRFSGAILPPGKRYRPYQA
jgi:hypothetical protein